MGTLREIMGHPKTDHEWTHSEKSQTQTKPNHGGTHSEKPWTHKDAPLPSPEFPIFHGRGALPNPSAKTSDCTADPPAEPEVGGGGSKSIPMITIKNMMDMMMTINLPWIVATR